MVFFTTGIEVGSAAAVALFGVTDAEIVTLGTVDATVTEVAGKTDVSEARNVTVAVEVVFPSVLVPTPDT